MIHNEIGLCKPGVNLFFSLASFRVEFSTTKTTTNNVWQSLQTVHCLLHFKGVT